MNRHKIEIAPLKEENLTQATEVFRLAFGTQFQLEDPISYGGDADLPYARFATNPAGALGAWKKGELVGSCFSSLWGSLGLIGPLTVAPQSWGIGIGKQLLKAAFSWLQSKKVSYLGLSTIPTSPVHLSLYRKFGFYPRFLYAIVSKPITAAVSPADHILYSALTPKGQEKALAACRHICDEILPGLDFQREIQSVFRQNTGDTFFIVTDNSIEGFGICHFGPGSEAQSGSLYLKAGAVRSGSKAHLRFRNLLNSSINLGSAKRLNRLLTGVNFARAEAVEVVMQQGFVIENTGVAMHHNNNEGYNRSQVFLVDDWR